MSERAGNGMVLCQSDNIANEMSEDNRNEITHVLLKLKTESEDVVYSFY